MKKFFIFNSLIALVFVLILSSVHFIFTRIISYEYQKTSTSFLRDGILTQLDNILIREPQKNWNKTIKSLYVVNSYPIEVVKYNTHHQKKNEETYVSWFNYLKTILSYSSDTIYVYKQIGSTPYALKLTKFGPAHVALTPGATAWTYSITYKILQSTPEKDWLNTIQRLAKQVNKIVGSQLIYKINFIQRNHVPEQIKNKLITSNLLLCENCLASSNEWMWFVTTPNPRLIMKVSTNVIPLTSFYRLLYFAVIFFTFIIAIFISIIGSYIFSKNVRTIYRMTKMFGQANFDYIPKFSRFSILKGIHDNVVVMGNNIENLMQLRQNMTNFIAHEARAPLTTMGFAINYLSQTKQLSADDLVQIRNIREDMNQLNKLISRFLLYLQAQANLLHVRPQYTSLSLWVRAWFEHYQSPDIKTVLDIPKEMHSLRITIDVELFRHVLDNLLTNALKFARSEVIVSLASEGNQLSIHVDDDGPGLLTDDIEKIFDPFETIGKKDDTGKHIGLGLSIAKRLVDLHNGTISVATSPQGGARFTVTIPL